MKIPLLPSVAVMEKENKKKKVSPQVASLAIQRMRIDKMGPSRATSFYDHRFNRLPYILVRNLEYAREKAVLKDDRTVIERIEAPEPPKPYMDLVAVQDTLRSAADRAEDTGFMHSRLFFLPWNHLTYPDSCYERVCKIRFPDCGQIREDAEDVTMLMCGIDKNSSWRSVYEFMCNCEREMATGLFSSGMIPYAGKPGSKVRAFPVGVSRSFAVYMTVKVTESTKRDGAELSTSTVTSIHCLPTYSMSILREKWTTAQLQGGIPKGIENPKVLGRFFCMICRDNTASVRTDRDAMMCKVYLIEDAGEKMTHMCTVSGLRGVPHDYAVKVVQGHIFCAFVYTAYDKESKVSNPSKGLLVCSFDMSKQKAGTRLPAISILAGTSLVRVSMAVNGNKRVEIVCSIDEEHRRGFLTYVMDSSHLRYLQEQDRIDPIDLERLQAQNNDKAIRLVRGSDADIEHVIKNEATEFYDARVLSVSCEVVPESERSKRAKDKSYEGGLKDIPTHVFIRHSGDPGTVMSMVLYPNYTEVQYRFPSKLEFEDPSAEEQFVSDKYAVPTAHVSGIGYSPCGADMYGPTYAVHGFDNSVRMIHHMTGFQMAESSSFMENQKGSEYRPPGVATQNYNSVAAFCRRVVTLMPDCTLIVNELLLDNYVDR